MYISFDNDIRFWDDAREFSFTGYNVVLYRIVS